MDLNRMQEAQVELASIREFCEENSNLTWDGMFDKVHERVTKLQSYCKEHSVPLVISLYDIVDEFCAPDKEEESSSYYEEEYYEESSYYEEEEEEEEEEELPEESSYYEE